MEHLDSLVSFLFVLFYYYSFQVGCLLEHRVVERYLRFVYFTLQGNTVLLFDIVFMKTVNQNKMSTKTLKQQLCRLSEDLIFFFFENRYEFHSWLI